LNFGFLVNFELHRSYAFVMVQILFSIDLVLHRSYAAARRMMRAQRKKGWWWLFLTTRFILALRGKYR